MKLIDVLKLTDYLSRIIIWDKEPAADNDEPLFDGFVDDVPWTIADAELCKCLDDGESAISIRKVGDDAAMVIGIDYYKED